MDMILQSGLNPVLAAVSGEMQPASVPVGTGSLIRWKSIPAASNISLLHVRELMSKAMVRVARE